MAELRQSLYALVEHPPTTPRAVEVVAAHGARFARRRRELRGAAGLALVVMVSAVGLGVARQDSKRSLFVATEGATTAGYVAEQPGGYIGTGTWHLMITRDGQVIELSSASSDHCGPIGVILPGDEVRGSITGRGSTLRVGEGFTCPDSP
ncbi:MAG: hypothetical protein QOD92_3665 [Acidimicrobiaceae bacterium]